MRETAPSAGFAREASPFLAGPRRMPRVPTPPTLRADVPLAPLTTLGVGGRARWLTVCRDAREVAAALDWAAQAACEVLVLGGGSNLLVADAGFDGLVLRVAAAATRFDTDGRVYAAAGADLDALVAEAVSRDLAGVECLAGIPGRVGAAPIQNIGAYGQEVAEVIERVHAVERATGAAVELDAAACGFGYRQSRFKRDGAHVVTGVTHRLRPGGDPTLRYAELERAAPAGASLQEVRDTVLALRRAKSMVIDPTDENRRSAGSFFENPVLDAAEVERVAAIAPPRMPRWPQPDGRVKLSAAWLIERSGLSKGAGDGPVGLSSRHTLALVNRGGATAAQVVAFAGAVRRRVFASYGVTLRPEPVFVGFDRPADALLSA